MRFPILAGAIATLAIAACTENTGPVEVAPTFHLSANVTGSGDCTVTALGHDYISNNAQRGDVGLKFVGTVPNDSYHGVGCWVGTEGGDGDLIIIFSGNSLGQPLAVGTYQLNREILDNTPLMHANVTFRNSEMPGDKLTTLDNAVGSVVVDSTASGARVIHADVELTRWRTNAF
jgi:hypothetical protein